MKEEENKNKTPDESCNIDYKLPTPENKIWAYIKAIVCSTTGFVYGVTKDIGKQFWKDLKSGKILNDLMDSAQNHKK